MFDAQLGAELLTLIVYVTQLSPLITTSEVEITFLMYCIPVSHHRKLLLRVVDQSSLSVSQGLLTINVELL